MKYKNAPIIEAVFDVRVGGVKIGTKDDLSGLKTVLQASGFVKDKKIMTFKNILNVSTDLNNALPTQDSSTELAGFVYLTEDETRQIQITEEGFTFNALKPYSSWEETFPEFLKFWSLYFTKFSPVSITRIAARYINRIELPLPIGDFDSYFVNMPMIPKCLPQTLSNFFIQLQIPFEDQQKTVILTQTLEARQESILPFLVDIDVFQQGELTNDLSQLTVEFEKIRKIKNDVFEEIITDKTRELFK